MEFVLNLLSEFLAVLHGDVVGIITKIGEGVTDFEVGDEVYDTVLQVLLKIRVVL